MDNSIINKILKRPIVTEKMTIMKDKKKRNGEPLNQYAFEVSKDANKIDIKAAIEKKFNVKVDSVRTSHVSGKSRVRYTRAGVNYGQTRSWKKAVVTLAKDNKIEFVEGV